MQCRTCRACREDRNVFSHKEHIGHKGGSAFAEATEDKTGSGRVEEWRGGGVGERGRGGVGDGEWLDFLAFELSEDITLKGSHSAEEPFFRKRQRIAVSQLLLYEFDRAYKVGDLKHFVS